MSAGNTVASDPGLAMTAPGSPSVLPVADVLDRLPLPVNSGPEIPVSTEQGRTRGNDGRFQSAGPWEQPGCMDEGSSDAWGWRQT
jgi:hypothetical protein